MRSPMSPNHHGLARDEATAAAPATAQGTMRAIVQERYGAPDEVFELRHIERPAVGPGEVLVRVHAVPVSGTDWHLYRGLPYVARLITGLRRPRNPVPGLELAGTVEQTGTGVDAFRPGDEVFGWTDGSLAEYASVPEDQLALRPVNVAFEEAAAGPIAAFTALQAIRDKARVRTGDKVLITGASGGVGTYAVQIAKSYGAEVTAVCSSAKADLVRAIGADHVIDYTSAPTTAGGERYDVLLDIYGNPSLADCRRALRPGGTLVPIGGTGGKWFMGVDRWLRAVLIAPLLRLKVRPLIHKDSRDDLMTLKELIESGDVQPILDATFPLARTAEAIRYVSEGRARGVVVVTT